MSKDDFIKEFARVTKNEASPNLPDDIIEGRADLLYIVDELIHSKLTVKELNDAYTFLAELLLGKHPKIAFTVMQNDRIRLPFAALEALSYTKGKLTEQERVIIAFCAFYSACIRFSDKKSGQIHSAIKLLTSPDKVMMYLNDDKEQHPERFEFLDKSESPAQFAVSIDNPVKATSIGAGYLYLNNLFTPEGQKVKYNRLGSMSGKNGGIIDGYTLEYVSGGKNQTMQIYIDPYSTEDSTEAPEGLIFALTSSSISNFSRGVFNTDMGNDDEAVRYYKQSAEEGNLMALNNLGLMYSQGRGVEQSYTKAFELYQIAAEKGLPDAQQNLAFYYSIGRVVEKDMNKAIYWWRKAAEQGDTRSQNTLGVLYQTGTEVRQDHIEALKWFTLAANQGDTQALCNLGTMYARGDGVPCDINQAIKFYTRAAELGDINALKYLQNFIAI